jgi:uncharacterized membrane protein YdjX (TVP38/TMEM64 family)
MNSRNSITNGNLFDKPSWKEVARNITLIVVTIGIAYAITFYIGLDNLRERVSDTGIYSLLIIVILKMTTIVVAPLGGTIIYPLAGAIFGFWKGLALCLIGDTIGSSIAFGLSRKFGKSILRYFTSESQQPIIDKVISTLGEKKGFVKTRIFFSGFMDLFAYAAGLTKINFWFFIVVHIAIHSIYATLLVIFGDLLVSGNLLYISAVAIIGISLAIVGAWLFHLDLARAN